MTRLATTGGYVMPTILSLCNVFSLGNMSVRVNGANNTLHSRRHLIIPRYCYGCRYDTTRHDAT